jgi:hypothetical protein
LFLLRQKRLRDKCVVHSLAVDLTLTQTNNISFLSLLGSDGEQNEAQNSKKEKEPAEDFELRFLQLLFKVKLKEKSSSHQLAIQLN